MNVRLRTLRLPVGLLAAGFLLLAIPAAQAVEPAHEFLKGLRERRYYDEALEYLDRMANSPLAPVELKETLLLEKGITLVEASRVQRDPQLRAQYLTNAQQLLTQFVNQRPDHDKANSARSQLGNLIVEGARIKVEDAKKDANAAPQLLKEARALYEEGVKVFTDLQEDVRVQLERIPKVLDPDDRQQARLAERRKQLRADYLQTQLLSAAIREESADTTQAGSEEYNTLLNDAAEQYKEIYTKYRTRLAGLYARMYQGRCNQKMGKLRDALGYYTELLDQPDTPEEFRLLKTKVMKLAMECWLDESQKKYLEARNRGADWITKARPTEDREPDWLYLRLMLAKAYRMQAEDAEANNDTTTANRSRVDARKLAQFVARFPSEYQAEAQQLVAELGGPDRTGEKPEPTNFDEARKAGREALDAIGPAKLAVHEIATRLAAAPDAEAKAEIQKLLGEGQQTLSTAQEDAMTYFRMALRLADNETQLEDINIVRYFLCYLYWDQQEYFHSALLGDFIARRYPGSAGARPSAKIALASYLQMYGQEEGEDKQFESDRIVSIAEYTVAQWPDQPEAEDALNALIPFMINAGELDKARQFLAQMPETSQKRGEAELKLGQALWRAYLQGLQEQQGEGADPPPDGAALEELKKQALEILAAGFGRSQSHQVDATLMLAALSLAQAYVDTQQADQAIAVLEHASTGPLTMVRANHAATQGAGFAAETYKTALRAYISSLGGAGGEGAIDKAKQVMVELKAAMGDTADGRQRLVNVYVGLATDLEKQLEGASSEARDALSQGFEAFLNQLSSEAKDLSVLNWVAETYDRLGRSFDTGQQLTTKANRYYEAAHDTFATIAKDIPLDPQMTIQVQIRQAQVRRRQQKFGDALKIYTALLAENEKMLNVQVEAAEMFQEWAALPKESKDHYMRAIQGYEKNPDTGKNVIWGWGSIAAKTARFPNFVDVFHQARYKLAECRLGYANSKQGDERNKLLDMAADDIAITHRLYGLGNQQQRSRYDQLLKKIQTARGQTPVGLQKFEADAKAKTKTKAKVGR